MGENSDDGFEMGHKATAKVVEPQISVVSQREQNDRYELARLGKKSVLKRNFGFMSILGFSCAVLITWEGALVCFQQGLQNGGPAGIIYNFLFVWTGNLALFSTLSELVSMAPTSGGQYHWVAMLAPRSCSKFLSYLTGWMTIAGWQGTVASAGFLMATMIQGLIKMTHPEYEPQPYQATLFMFAVLGFSVFINVLVSSVLPKFEGMLLVLHIIGFFAVMVPLVVLGPHGDAASVFKTFQNSGQWSSQVLSCFVGIIGNVVAFVGVDAAFHMCEEVQNPSVVVPRSIFTSCLINGATGFAMMIAILFCIGPDVETVLKTPTGFPHMQIFLNATGSVGGATTMAAIVATMMGSAGVGCLASASRVFWSFARDRGLPGWKYLARVDERTSVPIWAVGITTINACLLGLINLGSATALNDILSVCVSGLYISYMICGVLLLYRRCTRGFIMPEAGSELPALANTAGEALVWGWWHIPGIWGILINAYSIFYMAVILFFSFWPPTTPVDYTTMNYSIVVTGGVAVISVIYYLVHAKKEYKGPIIEVA